MTHPIPASPARTRCALTGAAALLASTALVAPPAAAADSGITVPPGFTATVFADHVGHARHMVVAPDGTLYVNTWSGKYYGDDAVPRGGFLVALKDTKGEGHADAVARFGATEAQGGHGGTGIAPLRRRALRRDQRPHRALRADAGRAGAAG